ncbi:hypothetical protein ACFR97_01095 [Haloplanus litoreus]|uniref:Sulfatase n=1 Tax=Haloplanus litoreus TaxID=767515 RepID=A0ABD5ZVM2_9EURY
MNRKRALKQLYATYLFFWLVATSRRPVGTNVFEREWDVLLILDTCRTDALRELGPEYEFIRDVEEIWSVGSTSKEWIEQTFTTQYASEIRNTAYITGNPFSNTLLGDRKRTKYGTTNETWIETVDWSAAFIRDNLVDPDEFGHIEPLWVDTESDARVADSQKPESITNHTIQAARSGEYDRVIAHYMQPHSPYFASSKEYDQLLEYEKHPFGALKDGTDRETVWAAYLENLRYVLDHVESLLENVDGDVVITADHGELFGEHRMYYHMPGNPHPRLKRVPWLRVEASDERTIRPDVTLDGRAGAPEASEKQLEALGYL